MPIRIILAGAAGWVGKSLVPAIANDPGLELTAAVSPSNAGKRLADVVSEYPGDIIISGSVSEALTVKADVFIDYTTPDAVKQNVLNAINAGLHCVIGTSGLTDEDYAEIDAAARAKGAGVLAAGNFAITAVLLAKFAETAARYVPSWEIIDYAGAGKPDAPSGTARELAVRLATIGKPETPVPVAEVNGVKEARGGTLGGTQVHSVRLPSFVLSAEVVFGAADERLTIRHDAGSSAEPYVGGTLYAVKRVSGFTGLRRGLDSIMDI